MSEGRATGTVNAVRIESFDMFGYGKKRASARKQNFKNKGREGNTRKRKLAQQEKKQKFSHLAILKRQPHREDVSVYANCRFLWYSYISSTFFFFAKNPKMTFYRSQHVKSYSTSKLFILYIILKKC